MNARLTFSLGSITHESQPSSAAEDALARYQEWMLLYLNALE